MEYNKNVKGGQGRGIQKEIGFKSGMYCLPG
jgi:hypothetical protein